MVPVHVLRAISVHSPAADVHALETQREVALPGVPTGSSVQAPGRRQQRREEDKGECAAAHATFIFAFGSGYG